MGTLDVPQYYLPSCGRLRVRMVSLPGGRRLMYAIRRRDLAKIIKRDRAEADRQAQAAGHKDALSARFKNAG
jgi:hypothetical protein